MRRHCGVRTPVVTSAREGVPGNDILVMSGCMMHVGDMRHIKSSLFTGSYCPALWDFRSPFPPAPPWTPRLMRVPRVPGASDGLGDHGSRGGDGGQPGWAGVNCSALRSREQQPQPVRGACSKPSCSWR